jgi:hypothetical protein
MFSLRRWTPARLHSTLKLRDSSPGVDNDIRDASTEDVDTQSTGPQRDDLST